MRLSGARRLQAPPAAIWAFLMTPERLRRCLPGCERFEAVAPDTFAATLRLGVGFLQGTYSGTICVSEQQYPQRLVLSVEGGGPLGSLRASGTLHLSGGEHATTLCYEGAACAAGWIASLGDRVIGATADKLFGRFWDCVASHVELPPAVP